MGEDHGGAEAADAADPATVFDPQDPRFIENPHAAYDAVRERAPVCPLGGPAMWAVTGREEMMAVLREPAGFTSTKNLDGAYPFTPEAQRLLDGSLFHRGALFNADPPGHARFRAFISEEFTPRNLRRREPAIREIADGLVRDFAGLGGVDLLPRFAYPLPMTVICDIIGVPREDRAMVKSWNNDWLVMQVVPLPPEEQLRCAQSVLDYEAYIRGLLADRRRRPADDLLTVFTEATAQSDPVCADEDAVVAIRVMLAAGHETTTNLIANTIYQLLRDRPLWEKIVGDLGLIGAAVEEGLRYDPSVLSAPRVARADMEVGGRTIPAGARVQVMYAAAGRDPGWVDDPDTFRLDRQGPPRHFGFGYGIHFCIGASLARLESRIALETLAKTLPGLDLEPGFEASHLPGGYVFHGLSALPVVWPRH